MTHHCNNPAVGLARALVLIGLVLIVGAWQACLGYKVIKSIGVDMIKVRMGMLSISGS